MLDWDEEDHILYFIQYAKSIGYEIAEEFMGKDRLLLKFLGSARYDYPKAIRMMMEHSVWLRSTFPVDFGAVGPLLQSGIMYVSKRDRMFRPIVIVNIRRLLATDISVDVLEQGSSFFFDFCVRKLLLPGKVENWIIIVDLDDIGIAKIPVKKVGAIISNG